MYRVSRRAVALVLVFALVLLAVATVSAHGNAPAGNFRAHLNGDSQPTPVDTDAQGQALFQFDHDAANLSYKLIVANINDVVASHIHCAPAGANGPVGVSLYAGGPTSSSGVLAQDTVSAPDAGNACGWTTLGDVMAAIEAGGAYVNVHTLANPPGEIRGQIR